MEREKKHQLAQLVALIGFLIVPLGGVVYSYLELQPVLGAGVAILGFVVFLAGAELAFKTKEGSESG